MGREIKKLVGRGSSRASKRQKLAKALGVTPGYLQFLEVGETRTDGKRMNPSESLQTRFARWRKRHAKKPL